MPHEKKRIKAIGKRVAQLHTMDITITHTRNYFILLGIAWFLGKVGLHDGARFISNLPLAEAQKKAVRFVPLKQSLTWFFKMKFCFSVAAFNALDGFPIKNCMACRLW